MRTCACVCVSVSVGGEAVGTLLWGRGRAVPPPAFEDKRNVRRRPFSFAQGGTCLARSQPTTSSLAGGRAGTPRRVGGDGRELGGPSCPSLLLQLLPLLTPQHLQVVSPPHSSLSSGRQRQNPAHQQQHFSDPLISKRFECIATLHTFL